MSAGPLCAYYGDDRDDPHAIKLHVSDAERSIVDRLPRQPGGRWFTVRDQGTGRLWGVRPAPCGGHCYCALEARPAVPDLAETVRVLSGQVS